MSKTFKTGYKFAGDSSGAVRATRAVRSELGKLDRDYKKLNRTSEKAAFIGKKVGVGIASIAAAAPVAAGAVFAFTKSVADQGDRVQKLSLQLGTSTEFLSGMSHAAELSGTSMDALGKGIKKMSKVVADAEAGLSTYTRAFDRIGISVEDIRQLSPEDQFYAIADAIANTEDQTLKMAAAQDIFGARMSELIPLLNQGSAGMKEAQEEAKRLGLVMSKEFADASAQFNDDLTRSKGVLTGIKRQIGEGLLPEMSALMQSFVDSANASEAWKSVGTFLGNVVRGLVASFITLKTIVEVTAKAFWTAAQVMVDAIQAIAAPFTEFGKSVAAAWKALTERNFSGIADAFTGLGDRIVATFTENVGDIEDRLKEFADDGTDAIRKGIDRVNDVLTRTAKVTQPAANGIGEVGEAAGEAAGEADKAAKAFQSLVDRLDPLSKLQRQFTVEQAILTAKIAEGGDGVAYYEMLLAALREEYAAAARAAVGFGDNVQKVSVTVQQSSATMAEDMVSVFKAGAERLDTLFADLWKGIFDGGADMMDSIKSFFKNWLAEMAHAAITRPVTLQLTSMFGMGSASGTAAASGGQAAGSVASAAGPLAAMGPYGWIAIGAMINAGLATSGWALGDNPFGASDMIRGASGNFMLGPIGAAMGTMAAGTAIVDKLFQSLGLNNEWASILSGAAGFNALFGHKAPKLQSMGLVGSYGVGGFSGEWLQNIKSKGGLFRSDKKWTETGAVPGEVQSLFDNLISETTDYASRLARELGINLMDEMAGWTRDVDLVLDKDPEIAQAQIEQFTEQMAEDLIAALADNFGEGVQGFVSAGIDASEQLERLSTATFALKAMQEIDLDRTFNEVLAVADSMRYAGETASAALERLSEGLLEIAGQLNSIDAFTASDIAADFDALVESQSMTMRDLVYDLGDQIKAMRDSFTGSYNDLQQLATLSSARYEAEIAYLSQIEQVVASITAGSVGLRDQIERDLYGDEAYYGRVKGRAESLAAGLSNMTDPSQIAATVAEIQRLTNIAYGLTPEDSRAAVGSEFLAFLDEVEGYALDRVGSAREAFLSDSAGIRSFVGELAAGFGDPLEIAATAQEGAAEALRQAGVAIESNVEEIPNAIRDGFADVTITPSFNISVYVDSTTGTGRAVVNA